jgi:hypothetical protein
MRGVFFGRPQARTARAGDSKAVRLQAAAGSRNVTESLLTTVPRSGTHFDLKLSTGSHDNPFIPLDVFLVTLRLEMVAGHARISSSWRNPWRANMAFRMMNEVHEWVAEHSEQELTDAFAEGRFGADSRTKNLVTQYLQARGAANAEKEMALRDREVAASETAAQAATKSAGHAERSARYAMWAVIIAVVALVVSVIR